MKITANLDTNSAQFAGVFGVMLNTGLTNASIPPKPATPQKVYAMQCRLAAMPS